MSGCVVSQQPGEQVVNTVQPCPDEPERSSAMGTAPVSNVSTVSWSTLIPFFIVVLRVPGEETLPGVGKIIRTGEEREPLRPIRGNGTRNAAVVPPTSRCGLAAARMPPGCTFPRGPGGVAVPRRAIAVRAVPVAFRPMLVVAWAEGSHLRVRARRTGRTAAGAGSAHPNAGDRKVTKKLILDPEELAVVSFETAAPAREKGTVRGYDRAWSDDSVRPTISPSERRICP